MDTSNKNRGPDFIIIGAMKCMTTTLHDQLAAQDGVFMSTPKEPCFFSDDDIYARGMPWYSSLFSSAVEGDICGESSTHYTKLPTYPLTAKRIVDAFPRLKLIYVMRHPIDRFISQYVHEWTRRVVNCSIDNSIDKHPEFVQYSQYSYQIEPYLRQFGPDKVLPVFFERLKTYPDQELNRIGQFLDISGRLNWQSELSVRNASAERMRASTYRDAIAYAPVISWVRRNLVSQSTRNRIKGFWQLTKKPRLSQSSYESLRRVFDEDLAQLGDWLGIPLNCNTFRETTCSTELNWRRGLEEQFASRSREATA